MKPNPINNERNLGIETPEDGIKKEVVKHYFYVQQGLNMLNLFRNLFYIIGIGYIALKLNNPFIMVPVFIVSLFLLDCLGWLDVNHMKKIIDYFNIKKATTYGKYGFKLQEKQIELLEEIRDKIKEK